MGAGVSKSANTCSLVFLEFCRVSLIKGREMLPEGRLEI